MKRYFLTVAIAIVAVAAFAQEKHQSGSKTQPPTAVQSSFEKDHPKATRVNWNREDQNFEANFIENKNVMSAVYNSSGELQETEIEISKGNLPANVLTYIQQHYKGNIKEAAKITKRNGDINYEAEVNDKDVIFDKDGHFIKEQKG